jgi:hypothetical protein
MQLLLVFGLTGDIPKLVFAVGDYAFIAFAMYMQFMVSKSWPIDTKKMLLLVLPTAPTINWSYSDLSVVDYE